MPGEIVRDDPGGSPSADWPAEPGPRVELAELSALAQVSPAQPLSPIPDNVLREVRDLAETLRVLFGSLRMPLNRLAALLHSDPGTVSRYLSGQRIPPPGFIDALCKAVYDANGSLVTPQVQELVHERFLVALRAHNPARYEVQRLTDLLQAAAQEKRQFEITAAALEEAIASRNDKIYELELEGRQLRSDWATAEGLLEEERKQRDRLEQTIASLYAEVSHFKVQLRAAQRRAGAAEKRCRELEAMLDFAGALLPDETQRTAGTEASQDSLPGSAGQSAGPADPLAQISALLQANPLLDISSLPRFNQLLQRIAQRQIDEADSFVRQIPLASEISYDGEARDWLLNLTREAEHSIDSISLSSVDAGMRGFEGGLWTSDLGVRYLELQRAAISRKVRIRRIFLFENRELANDETFLAIAQMQRGIGIEIRKLEYELIPDWLQSMISDYTIFDGLVGYERTSATAFAAGRTRSAIVRTALSPAPARINSLQEQFEQLWDAADPDRLMEE